MIDVKVGGIPSFAYKTNLSRSIIRFIRITLKAKEKIKHKIIQELKFLCFPYSSKDVAQVKDFIKVCQSQGHYVKTHCTK